jgi:lipopolysaccharide export system protein LptA
MTRAGLTLALCCLSFAAFAADAPKGGVLGSHDSSKPINIAADTMQADLNAKIVTYTGNVVVTQGEIKMRADTMKADNPNNKIYAKGKVVVDSPTSGTATGENGIYDLTKKLVTLSGNVVLNKPGQATMRGSLLTVNMVTGIATVGARAVGATPDQAAAPGLPGGRVQGVFIPKSAPDSRTPGGN